jgi:hypothetical protein
MRREGVSREEQMRRESQSAEEFDRRLKATEEAKIREEQRQFAEMQRERERLAAQGVTTLSGNRIPARFVQGIAHDLNPTGTLTIDSQPPARWSNSDLFESGIAAVDKAIAGRSLRKPRRRVMARDPMSGESFIAVEDEDQKTPLFGDRGRDYAE